MDRISSNAAQQSALLNILNAEARQNTAQTQVSTGKVANDLKGYAVQADTLTAVRSLNARLTSHIDSAKALSSTLTVQDGALSQIASSAQAARQAVAEAIATGSSEGLMASLQGQMSQAVDALNTQYQGRYLFSGGQTGTKPVTATDMTQLPVPASTASFFANDQLPTTSRLDDNTTATTGFLASNLGQPLFDALKAIQQVDSGPTGPLSGSLTPAQTTALQAALTNFDTAWDGLNQSVAQNGVMQNRVSTTQTSLTDRQTALTGVLGDMTDVDMAAAVSRLQLAQTAVQASSQAFSMLQSSSLLNLLSR